MSETAQPSSTRVCSSCSRPLRALQQDEYTDERAALVVQHGLCVCPGPARAASEPELTTT
ncbi:MAG: hypothetical protein WCA46_05130 [Actinocatenispora sp.]